MSTFSSKEPGSTTVTLPGGDGLQIGDVLDRLFVFAAILDRDGRVLDVNRGPLEVADLTRADVLGIAFWRTWWWSHDEAVAAYVRAAVTRALAGETVRFDVGCRARGDGRIRVDVQFAPLPGPDGQVGHVLASALDVSEREAGREALAASERRARHRLNELELIYDRAPVGLGLVDAERRLVRLNHRLAELAGAPLETLVGHDVRAAMPTLETTLAPALAHVFARGEPVLDQEVAGDPEGRRFWLVHLYPVPTPAGDTDAVGIICEDVTERRAAAEHLSESRRAAERQALHDPLTGLPNRALLSDRAQEQIKRARRDGGSMALLMMDLDDFKAVNDTLGHAAGDALLERVAERLRGAVRETDTVGRLGGDEFAVVTGALGGPADAAAVAERVLEALHAPVSVMGRPHVARASIGIALFPDDALRLGGLFRGADLAMYEAKSAGGSRTMFFEPEMREQLRARQQLERALRRALDEDAFELASCPRLSVADRRVVAVELALRWRHPIRGPVPVEDDLVFAERKGLGAAIATRTIDRALALLRDVVDENAAARVCVAFSPTQLTDARVVERLLEGLATRGIEGDRLQVELLTGADWTLDGDGLAEALARLADAGVNIALREFGTDRLAFRELRALPLDALVLAGELVRDLGRHDEAEAFVEALAALGRRLGKRVVARGVETGIQHELLRQAGCEEVTGPYVARAGGASMASMSA